MVKAVQLGDDLELPFVKRNSDSVTELAKEESSSVGVVPRDDEGDALEELKRGRGISAIRRISNYRIIYRSGHFERVFSGSLTGDC